MVEDGLEKSEYQNPFSGLYSEKDAAKYLKIKPEALRNYRHLKKGPKFLQSKKRATVYYKKESLDEYAKGRWKR